MTTELSIQEQIAAAKAALAEYERRNAEELTENRDDWHQPMDPPEELPALQAGDWIHAYGSVTMHVGDDVVASYRSLLTEYGQDIQLSPELIDFNSSLLAIVDDVEAQAKRFKRQIIARGKWNEATDGPRWERGSYREDLERDAARERAFQLTNDAERIAALRAVDATFGLRRTSQHLATYEFGGR